MKQLALFFMVIAGVLVIPPDSAFAASELENWCKSQQQDWQAHAHLCVVGQLQSETVITGTLTILEWEWLINGSSLVNDGTIYNVGTIDQQSGTFENNGTIYNNGTINHQSGTFQNNSTIYNNLCENAVINEIAPITGNGDILDLNKCSYLPVIIVAISEDPGANTPPNEPSTPTPANNATIQNLDVDLNWTGGDLDGDNVTYDVYFEANDSTPDQLLCNDTSATVCDPGILTLYMYYYWRVVAQDEHGSTKSGPLWNFYTISKIEEPNNSCEQAYQVEINIENQFLPDDSIDWFEFDLVESGNLKIQITDFQPQLGKVAVYKGNDCEFRVLLGEEGTEGTSKILDLGIQSPGHYFIFVSNDGALNDTDPYKVNVKTMAEPGGNSPPNKPSMPFPENGATTLDLNVDLNWTGGDLDGDNVTYDVYFEANDSTPDQLLCNNITTARCDPGLLNLFIHYYWRVVASDEHVSIEIGPLWNFYTISRVEEPNNTCGQAYQVEINIEHQFLPDDSLDWFEFDLVDSGNLEIQVTDFEPIFGQVAVYKGNDCSSRVFLGNKGDAGTSKILDLGVQAQGHYFIFVGNDGELNGANPYNLRVVFE